MAKNMQYGREVARQGTHASRSAPRNRDRGRTFVPYKPTWSPSFAHIQTVQPLEQSDDEETTGNSPFFVRHESLQAEIDDSSHYSPKHSLSSSESASAYSAPLSFAEAIAMPRRERDPDSRASAASGDPPAQEPTTPSSVQPRVTFRPNNRRKKPKKWTPLDLSTVEFGTSEADSTTLPDPAEEPSSPASTVPSSLEPSPIPASFAEVAAASYVPVSPPSLDPNVRSFQLHQWPSPHGQVVSHPAPKINKLNTRQEGSYFDPDPTPTQASFDRFPNPVSALERSNSEDPGLVLPEDSDSTKDKYESIMSRLDDAFDVEEWTSAIPETDENDSPQQLTVNPLPITYTTVGSLVKSNENLKFTAPVRIQREGSSRRPLAGAVNQTRGAESFFAGRTPTQSSFGFGSHQTLQSLIHGSLGGNPSNSMPSLPEVENTALCREGLPTPRPAAAPILFTSTTQSNPAANEPGRSNELLGLLKGDRAGHASSTQSSIAGSDRMQTWQRLASYANPMQQVAKQRLSGCAVSNMNAQTPSYPTSGSVSPLSGSYMGQPDNNLSATSQITGDNQNNGTLNYNFRFPASDSTNSQTSYNPMHGHMYPKTMAAKEPIPHQYQLPSGYPRPLTAGPPRQVPITIGAKRGYPSGSELNPTFFQGHNQYRPITTQLSQIDSNWDHPKYPWHNFGTTPQRQFVSALGVNPKIRNTADPTHIAQYYPHGWPSDMTAEVSYLSKTEADKDMGVESTITAEEEKQQKQDEWWYSGLRKARKGLEEHFSDGVQRDIERESGNAVVPPISRQIFNNEGCLTVEQINNMSATEAAAPLLDGLFGSIMSYADEHYNDATHKQMMSMSKFYTPPAWMIDTSEKGRMSFFGDDCGPTPKRLGRDPRYQHND